MYKIISIFSGIVFFFGLALETSLAQFPLRCYPQFHYAVPCVDTTSPRIAIDGQSIELKDGLDLSEKIILCTGLGTWNDDEPLKYEFKNINFSGSILRDVDFRSAVFIDCDFSRAKFTRVLIDRVSEGCNFEDAWIADTVIASSLSCNQLLSTASYKNKTLSGVVFSGDFSGSSFAGFRLDHSVISGDFTDCDFSDAEIEGTYIRGMLYTTTAPDGSTIPAPRFTIEQLLLTRNFKSGVVKGVTIHATFPDHVVDLSNMVFVDCTFIGHGKIDLTNSVITGCDFSQFGYRKENYLANTGKIIPYGSGGITLENVKSTWNYKHGRMEGIKLPEEIQKVLNAEKAQ